MRISLTEVVSAITLPEVSKALRKLPAGVGEIHPKNLKSLDVVGLSWRLGTAPVDWQTRRWFLFLRRWTRGCVLTTGGITLLSFPGKVYARVLEGRI